MGTEGRLKKDKSAISRVTIYVVFSPLGDIISCEKRDDACRKYSKGTKLLDIGRWLFENDE